jgi:hypothetical protein
MSEILGGARLWLDAIEGAQAVHTSSRTFLAWKQGLVLWTTVAEPKRAVTLPTLIVSVELDALSVACLGSGMLPVMLPVISGGVHGIPTRSNLAARAQSEPAQGSFAVLTCVKFARGIWNWTGRSSYQKIAGILSTAAGLARRTGYQAPYELSSEIRKSSNFHGLNIRWTRRLLGFWPLVSDDGNNVDAQLTHSSTKNEFSSFLRGFGVTSDAALTGFLALFILIVSRGGWRSLHESSLMPVTLLLFGVHSLLKAYLLHIHKVNHIRTTSKHAYQDLKGDPRFSSTSGTWRSLHQCYTLGSRMVFKEALTGFLALLILIVGRGRWQSLHESSLMSVTLLLISIHLLLEAYLLHIRKVNRIKTASKRACRGLKGDPRFSSTSGTWRSLHQGYTLGSRIVFKEVRKLLNAIVECPLEKGKQRIRWQCVSFFQTLTKITSIS